MTETAAIDVWAAAAAYLLIKHAIADFFLQTAFQYRNKGKYGHPGGVVHVAIHAALTSPVLLILPPRTIAVGAGILLAEALFHYHIDWSKDQVVNRWQLTPVDNGYWRALGVDQMLHGLTYVGIVWALASKLEF